MQQTNSKRTIIYGVQCERANIGSTKFTRFPKEEGGWCKGIAMLRSGEDSLEWDKEFPSFKISNFKVSRFRGSKLQRLSKSISCFFNRCWSHMTNIPVHIFWEILIPYSRFSKTCQTDLQDCSAPAFSGISMFCSSSGSLRFLQIMSCLKRFGNNSNTVVISRKRPK